MTKEFYEGTYTQLDDQKWKWRELGGEIKARNVITVVDKLPVKKILDIGSGTGAVIAHLAKFGFGERYYALDIADQAISILKGRSDIPNLVEARVFDGLHIPYEDQQFDLAILSHVVEHLINPVPLLLDAARVARYIAIEVPLEDNLYTHLKVGVFGSRYREELGHIQWFNPHKFRNLLEVGCNLEVMRLKIAYLPDQVYYFRKQGKSRFLMQLVLSMRKALQTLPDNLYVRLLTDHCIALVRSPQ